MSIQTGIELQDNFTNTIYSIINAVNLACTSMAEMQSVMSTQIDTAMMDGAIDQINQATMAMREFEEQVAGSSAAPSASPVDTPPVPNNQPAMPVWQSDGLEVFTNTGMERFEQEIQSANQMLMDLNETQNQIQQTAGTIDILPDNAMTDINGMGQRLQAIQQQIQEIENNPLDAGVDVVNGDLEQLRAQLNHAVQQQNELNTAIQNMDIDTANSAYLRLSQTIRNTERYLRDNVDTQTQFNEQIRDGTSEAHSLMGTIKGIAAAYIGIRSIRNVINVSDELVQTTARLDLMNDGLQSTDELVNMVYAAAQDARGSLSEMADVVARFGNNAKDAFSSSEEVVAFADLVQKQMTIAGASTQEASNAMLQLSQALGSGTLRGDELNSIFEQAPNLIQSIADYLDVPIGQIREMASEGELSADVVKAAIFSASDEINARFDSMPVTWSQTWQSMQNTAIMAFRPVLQRVNELANSAGFQRFVAGATEAMAIVASIVLNIFDLIGQVGSFVADNWSIIAPIVYGIIGALATYIVYLGIVKGIELATAVASAAMAVGKGLLAAATTIATHATWAQTTAQMGLNGAMYSCPIVWIIALIIALIAVIVMVFNWIAKTTKIANSGFGVITGGINVVIQFFKNLAIEAANVAIGIWNAFCACGHNLRTAFENSILNVQSLFYDLVSVALTCVEKIARQLSKLPFVEFDYKGIGNAADEYAAKAAELQGRKGEYRDVFSSFSEGMSTFDAFKDGWVSEAFDSGAAWGDGIADKISEFSLSDIFGKEEIPNPNDYMAQFDEINSNLGNVAHDTSDISDSIEISEENLKYLRDIAEQEAINKFTTAEIVVNQTNNNNVSSDTDLDGVVSGLTDAVNEAVNIITEGVHT